MLIGIAVAYSLMEVGVGAGYMLGVALTVAGAGLIGTRLASHTRRTPSPKPQ